MARDHLSQSAHGRPSPRTALERLASGADRAARDALALPDEWLPHALVMVGRPDPDYVGRPRPPVPVDDLRTFRP